MSASSRGNCYAVCLSLHFYSSSHSATALLKQRSWLPKEQLRMVSPCTGSCSLEPSLLELFQPLTLRRKTSMATAVLKGNSLSTVLDCHHQILGKGGLWPLSVKLRSTWMKDAGESYPLIHPSVHSGQSSRGAVESLGS